MLDLIPDGEVNLVLLRIEPLGEQRGQRYGLLLCPWRHSGPGTSVRGRGRGCVRARRRVPLRIPVRDLPDTAYTELEHDLDLPPSPRIVDLELPPRSDQAPRPTNTPCHQADTRSSVQSTYPGIFREASCGTRAPTPCRMLSKLHAKRQSPPYLRSGGSKKASPGGLRRRCHPWSL